MEVKTVTKITSLRAKEICKMGQGNTCCRYLFAGPSGLECGKHDDQMRAWVDRRVLTGQIVAKGDNCDGVKMLDL